MALLIGVLPMLARASLADLAWTSRFNGIADLQDAPVQVETDAAGNVFVSGQSRTSIEDPTRTEIVTVKYNPSGNEVWVRRFSGANNNSAAATAMRVDSSGNVIVGGYSSAANGDLQFTTIKYDNAGNQLWVGFYHGPGGGNDRLRSLDVDSLGNICVTGESNGANGTLDYATIKYAPDGTQLWAQRYDGPAHGEDRAVSLRVDTLGNCAVSGSSSGAGSGADIAIVKYDTTGNELWVRRYTSPGAHEDAGGEIQVDASGNIYVTGSAEGSAGLDIVLLKYDPNGAPLWVQRYDGPAHGSDQNHVLAVDRDGYAHLAGTSENANGNTDLLTLRYAPDGTKLWEKRYNGTGNGDDSGSSVALDRIGNVYVAGDSPGDGTASDSVLIKYDANGHELWVRRYDGPGHTDDLTGSHEPLWVDDDFNVYLTGGSAHGAAAETEDFATLKFTQPPADGSGFEIVHDFDGQDGSQPNALLRTADGTFLGTTATGGPDDLGTIFRLQKDGRFETLFSFREDEASGDFPSSGPLAELNGAFYGTTSGNGVNTPGSIFKIAANGSFTPLHDFAFSGSEGRIPNGGLTLGNDGNFYGTTQEGGANNGGTFFRVTPAGEFTRLLDFDGAKGTGPNGQLLLLDDGSFLGTAREGGTGNGGTIFRVTTSGDFTLLHEFAFATGVAPESGIVRGPGGRYFGVVPLGGPNGGATGSGVFYEITLAGDYSALFNFAPATGSRPAAGLLLASDGAFYGVARTGGPEDLGAIYRLTATGEYSALHFFSDVAGDVLDPNAPLVEGTDGRLYGTTQLGGSDFGGFLFRLPLPPEPSATPAERGLHASMPVGAPPAFDASLTVNLTSTGNAGQWRLAGELAWRDSGTQIIGLATGDYLVEFKPVENRAPDPELIHVEGATVPPTFIYPTTDPVLTGGVSVIIKPDYIATAKDEALRGQWRRVGDTAYHNSGETVSLPLGVYLIEFKGVSGRRTPLKASVLVQANSISEFTGTYFPQPMLNGAQPVELSVAAATTSEPYDFCGQILSDAGTSTGFAVTDRVVLTAGHVIFDESSLTFTGGLRWHFQRMRGDVEPVPMEPRGAYLLDGYAAARQKPGVVPGESTIESQQSDVGAIYFNTSAARGGFSGYLVSSAAFEWVGRAGQKTIVGYPTEIVAEASRGRMFATPLMPVDFNRVLAPPGIASQVWRTRKIGGLPGMSGGPLFAEFDGGGMYPAGVFLGGNGEALVRAIDEQVEALIQNAAISASTGQHNTNGGSIQVDSRVSAAAFTLTALTVNLSPAAGTGWRLIDPKHPTPGTFQSSGTTRTGLTLGTYTVEFADLPGFVKPAAQLVTLNSSDTKTIAATYVPLPPAIITSDSTALLSRNLVFNYQVTATNQPTSFMLTGALPGGLNFDGAAIAGTVASNVALGDYPVTLQATNAAGLGPQFTLTLHVVPAGTLNVTINNAVGGSVQPAINSPKMVPQGTLITLTARPKSGFLFVGWTGTKPASSARLTFKMPAFATITANFVPNPFFEIGGNYSGLVGSIPAEFAKAGKLTVDMTPTGRFTAMLRLGKAEYAFHGRFDLDGKFQGPISRGRSLAALPITLDLELDPTGARQITGQIMLDGVPLDVVLDRASYSRNAPAPQKGAYTLVFPHDANRVGSEIPQGDGFAAAIVKSNGSVRFQGRLGDGAAFAESARLTRTDRTPLHVQLYKNKGAVSGDVSFPIAPSDYDVTGTLAWFRPDNRRAAVYPAGFTASLTALGSRFTPIPLVDFDVATVMIGAGGLDDVPSLFDLKFTPQGKATPPAGLPFSLKFTLGTALFKGEFLNPSTRKPIPFVGALLQNSGAGYGFFRGTDKQTGFVEFIATP